MNSTHTFNFQICRCLGVGHLVSVFTDILRPCDGDHKAPHCTNVLAINIFTKVNRLTILKPFALCTGIGDFTLKFSTLRFCHSLVMKGSADGTTCRITTLHEISVQHYLCTQVILLKRKITNNQLTLNHYQRKPMANLKTASKVLT